eukprot:Gregarina_sp_Poly_1__8978@NODE_545_length_7585_cov_19_130753_g432_i0_p1_GENE_NODE_545_length_7585_cov_19_130753_g432_i0NODE_545_length_7585_cov_19_130753_g432_i0_p1_ORF_typecomplete_len1150_score159_41UPF0220/PF05255_11/1_2e03UPF0220/PF05255_11/0_18DUF872/PF05915_12/0_52_NODE_545_length_7585_cov_19_130753_g432_i023175766
MRILGIWNAHIPSHLHLFIHYTSEPSFTSILGEFKSMVAMEGIVVRFATHEIVELHRKKAAEMDSCISRESQSRGAPTVSTSPRIRNSVADCRSPVGSVTTPRNRSLSTPHADECYDTTPMEGLTSNPFATLMANSIAVALSPVALSPGGVSSVCSSASSIRSATGLTAAVSDFFAGRSRMVTPWTSRKPRLDETPISSGMGGFQRNATPIRDSPSSSVLDSEQAQALKRRSLGCFSVKRNSLRTPPKSSPLSFKRRRRSVESMSDTLRLRSDSFLDTGRYNNNPQSSLRSPIAAVRHRFSAMARLLRRNKNRITSFNLITTGDASSPGESLRRRSDTSDDQVSAACVHARSITSETPLRVTGTSARFVPKSRASAATSRSRTSSSPVPVTSRTPVRRGVRVPQDSLLEYPWQRGQLASRFTNTTTTRTSDGLSTRSPDTLGDDRFFDDDLMSTTTGDFERAVQNDLWIQAPDPSDRPSRCLPIWSSNLAHVWKVVSTVTTVAATKIFNYCYRISLSREFTIFPASKRQRVTLPEHRPFCHFVDRRYENWYCEWLQTYTPKVFQYMRRPLLICTFLQFLLILFESCIFAPRSGLAMKVLAANWTPAMERSPQLIFETGHVWIDRERLTQFDAIVVQKWIVLCIIVRAFANITANLWIIGSINFRRNGKKNGQGRRIHCKEFLLLLIQLSFGTCDLILSCAVLQRYGFSGYRGPPLTVLGAVCVVPIYAPTLRPPIVIISLLSFFIVNTCIVGLSTPSLQVVVHFGTWYFGVCSIVGLLIIRSFERRRRHVFGRWVLPYLIYLDGLSQWIQQMEASYGPDSQSLFFSLILGNNEQTLDYELSGSLDAKQRLQTTGVQWSEGVVGGASYVGTDSSDANNDSTDLYQNVSPAPPMVAPIHQCHSASSNESLRLYCLPGVFLLGTAASTVTDSEEKDTNYVPRIIEESTLDSPQIMSSDVTQLMTSIDGRLMSPQAQYNISKASKSNATVSGEAEILAKEVLQQPSPDTSAQTEVESSVRPSDPGTEMSFLFPPSSAFEWSADDGVDHSRISYVSEIESETEIETKAAAPEITTPTPVTEKKPSKGMVTATNFPAFSALSVEPQISLKSGEYSYRAPLAVSSSFILQSPITGTESRFNQQPLMKSLLQQKKRH